MTLFPRFLCHFVAVQWVHLLRLSASNAVAIVGNTNHIKNILNIADVRKHRTFMPIYRLFLVWTHTHRCTSKCISFAYFASSVMKMKNIYFFDGKWKKKGTQHILSRLIQIKCHLWLCFRWEFIHTVEKREFRWNWIFLKCDCVQEYGVSSK